MLKADMKADMAKRHKPKIPCLIKFWKIPTLAVEDSTAKHALNFFVLHN